jgi:hypothetical protein
VNDSEHDRSLDEFAALRAFVPESEPKTDGDDAAWDREYPPVPELTTDNDHITGAALRFHPLLDGATAWHCSVTDIEEEKPSPLIEYRGTGEAENDAIYLVRRGLFNLTAKKGGKTWTASLLRPGQWIGMPLLLRLWHGRKRLLLSALVSWGVRALLGRPIDAMLGQHLLASQAGADQAEVAADVLIHMEPTTVSFYHLWRGQALVDELKEDHKLLWIRSLRGEQKQSLLYLDEIEHSELKRLWQTFYPARQ